MSGQKLKFSLRPRQQLCTTHPKRLYAARRADLRLASYDASYHRPL
jgi:hypothetical protein